MPALDCFAFDSPKFVAQSVTASTQSGTLISSLFLLWSRSTRLVEIRRRRYGDRIHIPYKPQIGMLSRYLSSARSLETFTSSIAILERHSGQVMFMSLQDVIRRSTGSIAECFCRLWAVHGQSGVQVAPGAWKVGLSVCMVRRLRRKRKVRIAGKVCAYVYGLVGVF